MAMSNVLSTPKITVTTHLTPRSLFRPGKSSSTPKIDSNISRLSSACDYEPNLSIITDIETPSKKLNFSHYTSPIISKPIGKK